MLNSLVHFDYKIYYIIRMQNKGSPSQARKPIGQRRSPFPLPSARHQLTLPDHGYGASARAVCLFMLQLSLVLIAPTHGGMARLSSSGWMVAYRDGPSVCPSADSHPSKY